MNLFLTALALLLASTAHADAAPVGAAIALIGGVLKAGGIGAMLLKAAFSVALTFGSSLIARAMAKKQPAPGVKGQIEVGGAAPLSFLLGSYATAGHLEYINSWGQSGKTPNAYLTMVVSLADLPISSLSSTIWVNGQKCTIDAGGAVTDWGTPVAQFRQNGVDFLWVKFLDGSQLAADPFLLDKFGGDALRPWLADMIGLGLPLAIVTGLVNRELMTGAPQCRFVFEGLPLYDIRADSTAGGDGPQRWSDPSTWTFSDNNAVAIYNIVRGVRHDGEWVYGGQDQPAFRLPASSWMAAMNECDALIDLDGGGQEKQFRFGMEVRCNVEPLATIQELLKGCNGRMAEIGGIYKVRVGAPGLPVYSFTDADIVTTQGQSIDPFPGLESSINGVHASYPEPEEAWETKDAPPRYSPEYEAEDDGRRQLADLSFATAPFPTQVQRLMLSMLRTERRFLGHQLTLPPEAAELEPLETVAWSSARNGYSDKSFELDAIDDLDNTLQAVAMREVDPSDNDWTPGTDELPWSVGALGSIRPSPQPIVDWDADPHEHVGADGRARAAILLSWDGDQPDVDFVRFRVREAGETLPFYSSSTADVSRGSIIITESLIANTDYEAQGEYWSVSGRPMEPSDWLPVTTPDVKIGTFDIYDDAITTDKIAEAAITASLLLDGAVTEVKLAALAVSTAKIQIDAVTNALIANDAVLAENIAALAVTEAKVAAAAISTAKLADGAITEGKLGALAVTAAKLASNAVTETKIASNAVTTPKLVASAVVADKVAANAIVASKLVLSNASDLVSNGSFDAGLADWNVTDGTVSIVAGSSVSASAPSPFVAEVASNGGTVNFMSGDAASIGWEVKEGEEYLFSAVWGKLATTGTARFIAHLVDKAGATTASSTVISINSDTANNWSTRTGTITIPANVTRMYLRFSWTTSGGGPIYLTKLKVMRRAPSELIVDGAIIANKIAAGAITAGKIAAGSIVAADIASGTITATQIASGTITAAKIAAGTITATEIAAGTITGAKIAAGTITGSLIQAATIVGSNIAANAITASKLIITNTSNLLSNGSFKSGDLAGWTEFSPAFTRAALWSSISGGTGPTKYVCELLASGGTVEIVNTDTGINSDAGIEVKAGEKYLFSIDGFPISFGGTPRVLAYYILADGTETFSVAFSITGPGSQWNNYTGIVTVPSNARKMFYYINWPSSSGGPIYVTNCIVIRMASAELIVDGAITAAKIATNSITAGMIQAGAITADKIAVGTITADRIVLGGVTTDRIADRAITAAPASNDGGNGPTATRTATVNVTVAVGDTVLLFGKGRGSVSSGDAASGTGVTVSVTKSVNGGTATTLDSVTDAVGAGTVAKLNLNPIQADVVTIAGTNTYVLTVQCNTGDGTSSITSNHAFITAIRIMK